MSNPYASPEPNGQQPQQPQQPSWSAQQPVPPVQPVQPQGEWGQGTPGQQDGHTQQGPYAEPTGQQDAWGQSGGYAQQGQQQAWGQPGYGQYGQYGTASLVEADRIRSNSTIVLVLGILGLVLIGLFGSIPAWVWGNSLIRQAQEAGLPDDVTQNARVGKILGIIAVVLWGLGIVLAIILVIGFGVLASNTGGSY